MVKYQIEVEDDLWTRFKQLVPRTKTLNDVIVELIKEHVEAEE